MAVIQDGSSGKTLNVDQHGRAATTADILEYDFVINYTSGRVWSIPFETLSATGNNDYILYIKNEGDRVIHIPDIRITADTQSTLEVNYVSGTALNGVNITPVSRTANSGVPFIGISQSGSDITGITSTGTLFFLECETANKQHRNHTHSTIRLPRNQAIGILAKSLTPVHRGTITVVEEENGAT